MRLLSVDNIDDTNAVSFRYMTKMYFQKDNIFKHIMKRINRFMIDLKIKSIAKKLVKIGYANTMSGNYIIGFEEAAKIYQYKSRIYRDLSERHCCTY